MTKFRLSILAIAFAAIASLLVNSTFAQPGKDMKKTVQEIANLMRKADKTPDKKGDMKPAKMLAAKAAMELGEFIDLMAMFRTRENGGLGVGAVPGPNPVKDGIDITIRDLARNVPPAALKNSAALEEMGYQIAAIGEIVHARGLKAKEEKQKTKKAWHEYSEDTHNTGLRFAQAVATKNPAQIKLAALKVNIACGGCHAFFKE